MQLVPCPQCRRHVDARETACPFCGGRVVARPQLVAPRGKLTRAAVFSAALVGCEAKHDAPKPAPAPQQQQGSDDLEKMLDGDHRVDRPAPPADAAVADLPADAGATSAAATIDAGTPVDIAVPTRGHGHHIRKHLDAPPPPPPPPDDTVVNPNWHQNPKPYGAPPARRRVV